MNDYCVNIGVTLTSVQALVEGEVKAGIPRNRIFIGGFSQGGAVALYTAFLVNKQIGGVVALSTWMPLHKQILDPKVHTTS
jgi:lysophospholipase-2